MGRDVLKKKSDEEEEQTHKPGSFIMRSRDISYDSTPSLFKTKPPFAGDECSVRFQTIGGRFRAWTPLQRMGKMVD